MTTSIKFTQEELEELELALEDYESIAFDPESKNHIITETGRRLEYRIGLALNRPWVKKYKNESHFIDEFHKMGKLIYEEIHPNS